MTKTQNNPTKNENEFFEIKYTPYNLWEIADAYIVLVCHLVQNLWRSQVNHNST